MIGSTGLVIIVDRREEYYGLASPHIARDPLGFYTRAERGRQVQAAARALPSRFDPPKPEPEPVAATPVEPAVDINSRRRARRGQA